MKVKLDKQAATQAAWDAYHADPETLDRLWTHIAACVQEELAGPIEHPIALKAIEYAWKLGFYAALESIERGVELQQEASKN